jgi:hypothetical protein
MKVLSSPNFTGCEALQPIITRKDPAWENRGREAPNTAGSSSKLSYRMSLLDNVNRPDVELLQCWLDLRAVSHAHYDGRLGMEILLRSA